MADEKRIGDDPTGVQTVAVLDDPTAPSAEVSSRKQSLSDIFTIVCCAFSPLDVVSGNPSMMKGGALRKEQIR